MAAINDLISQIQDAELRERIQKEVNKPELFTEQYLKR